MKKEHTKASAQDKASDVGKQAAIHQETERRKVTLLEMMTVEFVVCGVFGDLPYVLLQ